MDDSLVHKKGLKGRKEPNGKKLQNSATKDLVTTEIKESLINVNNLGQSPMEELVNDRLIADQPKTTLCDPIHWNKLLIEVKLAKVCKKKWTDEALWF